jgi:hypothetical protein
MRELGLLKALLSGRGALLELFFAAVLLALGVNLLASGLSALSNISSGRLILLSSVLIIISFSLIARKLLERRYVQRKFGGIFLYNQQKNELVRIPAYKFSEETSNYFASLFAENEAMRKLWDSEPIGTIIEHDIESNRMIIRDVASRALIREATEYFLLDNLSTHLKNYFEQSSLDENRLKDFGREDVPTVLFKNRFLDMFSRPMIERPAFVDREWPTKTKPIRASVRYGADRVMIQYVSFDLVLPRKGLCTKSPVR